MSNTKDSNVRYVECCCGDASHVTRFVWFKESFDSEPDEMYVDVQLNIILPWYKRAWHGIRYIFGYKSRLGHFNSSSMWAHEVGQLRDLCDEFLKRPGS